MEYLVVKFDEDRGVIVDEASGAWRTNRTLMLQAGAHSISLVTPPELPTAGAGGGIDLHFGD